MPGENIKKIVDDLRLEVERNRSVDQSAITLLNGINDRIKAAVDQALANGATAEELQPLTDLQVQLKTDTDALAAAVSANTPGEPPAPAARNR